MTRKTMISGHPPRARHHELWSLVGLRNHFCNKASGGDGIPAELFKILKDDAVKMLRTLCQQIWKTQQGPQDWKMSVLIPSPKEVQCQRMFKLQTAQLCSFQMPIRLCSKSFKLASAVHEPRTSRCISWVWKRQKTRDQIDNIHWIIEKTKEFQKNIYFCFIDYAKAFDCVDHNKLWKLLHSFISVAQSCPALWDPMNCSTPGLLVHH